MHAPDTDDPEGAARTSRRATLRVDEEGGRIRLVLAGSLVLDEIDRLRGQLADVGRPASVDLSEVDQLDTAGAWLVATLAPGQDVAVTGATGPQAQLIEAVRSTLADRADAPPPHRRGVLASLDAVGRWSAGAIGAIGETTGFFGLTLARMVPLLVRPWRLRITSLVHHMQASGIEAIPIVSLMAFLIGVVLAFQGATQLRQFGAEVFVVELIAISVLRELGVLLTAIIVAGRTGAAFTSAIGSMKMREEIDAMRTLGLDPIEVLVVPRVLALVLMLPLLGLIANLAGLLGGALMSWIELGVSPGVFQTRLTENVGVWNFAVGMIKAPVFALIIAIVGCHQGFAVEGNAESLGRLTSRSVVIAIFTVIVADAMFSIFFSLVGV
jgi:phospholipid/cholesterol/gamma-HCH transport system permease protein